MKLMGKKALITGGNSGIGLATARLFVAEGAEVAITGRDQGTLDKAVAELGSKARGYRPEPRIQKPTDAIIRMSATCVCGSDLWPFRGIQKVQQPMAMGHEYCGIVSIRQASWGRWRVV